MNLLLNFFIIKKKNIAELHLVSKKIYYLQSKKNNTWVDPPMKWPCGYIMKKDATLSNLLTQLLFLTIKLYKMHPQSWGK